MDTQLFSQMDILQYKMNFEGICVCLFLCTVFFATGTLCEGLRLKNKIRKAVAACGEDPEFLVGTVGEYLVSLAILDPEKVRDVLEKIE